jgi:cell division protein FtsL
MKFVDYYKVLGLKKSASSAHTAVSKTAVTRTNLAVPYKKQSAMEI